MGYSKNYKKMYWGVTSSIIAPTYISNNTKISQNYQRAAMFFVHIYQMIGPFVWTEILSGKWGTNCTLLTIPILAAYNREAPAHASAYYLCL